MGYFGRCEVCGEPAVELRHYEDGAIIALCEKHYRESFSNKKIKRIAEKRRKEGVKRTEVRNMSEYPIDPYLKVLDAKDIRKSGKWWTAVLKVCPKDRPDVISVRLYRWQKRGGVWKKVSSFNINRVEDWKEIRRIIDGMW